jgi:hypothetical protein
MNNGMLFLLDVCVAVYILCPHLARISDAADQRSLLSQWNVQISAIAR